MVFIVNCGVCNVKCEYLYDYVVGHKRIKAPKEAAVSQNGSNSDRAADLTWLSNWNKMGLLVVVVEISNKVYRQIF